VIKGA